TNIYAEGKDLVHDSFIDTITTLPTTTITASQKLKAQNFNIQIVGESLLNNLSNNQLSDAMKMMSGVTLKDFGGTGGLKTISVRGLGSTNSAIAINDMKINNSLNGQIDLGKIFLDNIYEVQLLNETSNFNFPASNSVTPNLILIKKKQPNFKESQRVKFNTGFGYGSYTLINPSANISVKIGKNNYISLNTNYLQNNGNYKYKIKNGNQVLEGTRKTSFSRMGNAEMELGNLGRDAMNNNSTAFSYLFTFNYSYNFRELPGHIILYSENNAQDLLEHDFLASGKIKYQFDSTMFLTIFLKYNHNKLIYTDTNVFSSSGILQNTYLQDEYLASAVFNKKLWKFTLGLASDFSFNNMSSDVQNSSFQPKRMSLFNDLRASFQHRELNVFVNLLHQSIFNFFNKNVTDHRFSPAFHIDYSFKNTWKIRFFVKENYRNPSFMENFYNNNVGSTNHLKPETTFQIDLGSDFYKNNAGILDYIIISSDFYYNNICDKILAIPTHNLFNWTIQNIGKVQTFGYDISLKFNIIPIKKLEIYTLANYSFQKALDYSFAESSNYKKQLPYTPEHSGNFTFGINYFINFNYSFIFSGKRYSLGNQSILNYLPPFFEHNVHISKDFSIKDKIKIRTFVSINNLGNLHYEIVKYYPMPGINFKLGVKVFN
ncbi:MAG: TonB-dependent receptor, partial [Bacteroidales bacterium]|nr:TonB-dependent receptor [Bacteroidales bacterium]